MAFPTELHLAGRQHTHYGDFVFEVTLVIGVLAYALALLVVVHDQLVKRAQPRQPEQPVGELTVQPFQLLGLVVVAIAVLDGLAF